MAEDVRRTPLYEAHRRLGARMVPFAGWDMPVQYAGILDEARSVRRRAGIFDVSHMGRYVLSGTGALATLDRVMSNAIADVEPGMARYTLLPNATGGIVDDIIVYRIAPEQYLAVANAANAEADGAWLHEHAAPSTSIEDHTAATAAIAVQGPAAVELVARLYDPALAEAPRFSVVERGGARGAWLFCRTGYTGEDGFEIVAPAGDAERLWAELREAGATPCGLGARDVLRTEAGYPLYGHEIDADTSPVDAGLMWAVRLDGRDFVGRDAIAARRVAGPTRSLVGVVVAGRVVPRQGYTLYRCQEVAGTVTSGVFSPQRECGVGLAYVSRPHGRSGTALELEVRGTRHAATVVSRRDLLVRNAAG